MIRMASALVAAASIAGAAHAQSTPPPRPDCSAAEYRQLDFWLGEWRVFRTVDGVEVGASRIEREANGCAIHERYESPQAPGGAYLGVSYSAWDRKDGRWRQMYVDVSGNVTLYVGGLEGGAMALTAAGRQGSIQRMVYTPLPDGAVTQVGTVSTDGGKTWTPGYDYTYRRR